MTGAAARLLGLDDPASPSPAAPPPAALVQQLRQLIRGEELDDAAAERLAASGMTENELLAGIVAVVPEALEAHRRAGIPDNVTTAGLRDIGRKRSAYGAAHVLPWIIGILRGDVIELGRLQVERRPGPHGHALHIPEGAPLTPASVDESLTLIRQTCGEVPLACTSWVLDAAIAEDLPSSNLAHFARRFRVVRADDPAEGSANEAVSKFVFRRPFSEVLDDATVVPVTSLERAVASRLRAGYRWTQPVGVLER